MIIFQAAGPTIIFEDNFSAADSYWYWRTNGNASHIVSPTGYSFTVADLANDSAYSNAEIYEPGGNRPWLRVRAVFHIANPSLQAGSRGWGFWNGSMDQTQSVMAWFSYMSGTGGIAPDGFYACTQIFGQAPVLTPITGVALALWHEFEIDWQSNRVVYSIDNTTAVTHNISPDLNMRLDVWVDNAVYDTNWQHVYQDIPADSILEIDRITVYDR